ncbi:type 1 glutamine amidotransferase [Methanolobus sp. WCC5]|uniref:type 1 glutamine amidotransferase n=1 Tax=Methanolobus sp. WCC5 TaxID=3125785 RepID=UPI0032530A41
MKIHCLVHLEFETLGNIREWICNKKHALSLGIPAEDSVFPQMDDFDLLIIMGGLMSVYQEDDFPWLRNEKQFVRDVIDSGKAVYGVCFGAQMISEVLGGKVSQSRYKEIGWHKVRSLGPFYEDDSLFHVPADFVAFHWHGDTFTLPAGARRLFESEACPEQGFIYGGNVLAVQFHPEIDEGCVENLIKNCGSDLVEGRYIQHMEEICGRDDLILSSSSLMFSILDWFENKIEQR